MIPALTTVSSRCGSTGHCWPTTVQVRYRTAWDGTYGSNFTFGTNFAMISDYTEWPVDTDGSIYYDDVKFSTTYIGVTPNGLPSAPNNLRIIPPPGAFGARLAAPAPFHRRPTLPPPERLSLAPAGPSTRTLSESWPWARANGVGEKR